MHAPDAIRRFSLWGIRVAAIDYDGALHSIFEAAERKRKFLVTALAVHGLTEGVLHESFARTLASIDLVLPDGQPVRHALNIIYRTELSDRVYGPDLTIRACERAAREGRRLFLYGSTDQVLSELRRTLIERFPALSIRGSRASAFRELTPQELAELETEIEESGADILFVGLGCPRQEFFATSLQKIRIPVICVGAAFDFISGTKPMAPRWMQDASLEWAFRLAIEPTRLWRRYLLRNPYFIFLMVAHFIGLRSATKDRP